MLTINLNLPTLPTQDQKDAMDGANTPDSTNVFITANDLTIPTLQEVTDSGNTTTNDIQFDSGAGILLDNTSRLREGTIDAGFGGTKGIAQICAVGYELKWEAGRLYVMDGNGLLIRHSLYNFTTVPSANDDSTKGYYVGSLWSLDNGVSYICTDSTSTAATWSLYEATPQVNSDWNAVSGVEEILNKPTIPDASLLVPYTGANADVNLGEFGIQLGNLEFDNTPTNVPTGAGSLVWNNTDGTLDLKLKGGNVTLQVGQEQVTRVVNKTATNISLLEANYQAVRITGAQGQRLKVDLALATTDVLSAETIGLVTETIANNQEGFVTTSGLIRGINTTGSLQSETWADGDILYLSGVTAGRITNVKPTAPIHLIVIGYVVHSHITQGTIYVKVDNGYELGELHNVFINGVANNNLLAYESSTSLWKNKTASALGLSEKSILLFSAALSPADLSDYYFFIGYLVATTSPNQKRFKFESGSTTAIKLALQITNLGAASSELVTLNLRNITTATDYLIGTFDMSLVVANTNWLFEFNFSHTINTTDQWAIKMTTPAWVTNPTSVVMQLKLYYK